METVDAAFTVFLLIIALGAGAGVYIAHVDLNERVAQQEEDYGLGSAVTTTSEYEDLTNDTFTGVVVGGDCLRDSSLTIRSEDGVERQIATKFLEPVD